MDTPEAGVAGAEGRVRAVCLAEVETVAGKEEAATVVEMVEEEKVAATGAATAEATAVDEREVEGLVEEGLAAAMEGVGWREEECSEAVSGMEVTG